MIVFFFTSCTVKNPINGPKNVHFSVVALPDSTPIDSIPCALIKIHTIAFYPVTDGYTNETGFCSLLFDFEYERYISYSAELLEDQETGLIFRGLSKTIGYYRVTKKSEIIDVARKSDFLIKKVLEPLGTLHLIFNYVSEDFDLVNLELFEDNVCIHSRQLSKNYLPDTMNYYCSALKQIRIEYSLIKNNEIKSTGSDSCRLEKFTTRSKVLTFR